MDEYDVMWTPTQWLVFAVALLAAGIVAFHFSGLTVTRKPAPQENIHWLETPIAIQKDEKGNVVGYIVLGADDKGYARIGHAPPNSVTVPPPAPQQPTARKAEEPKAKK